MFLHKLKFLFFISFIFLFDSCANYKLNYTKEAENWGDAQPDPNLKLRHSVFLIGDTGNASSGSNPNFLNLFGDHLSKAGKESSVIFLGDNIYPVGMPPKEDSFRKDAEEKLDVQLDVLKDYEGKVIFIPGNHDWYKHGRKGVKRQGKYIDKHLNKLLGVEDDESDDWKQYFYPGGACGDPQTLIINDQLVIVLIDSEWWLQNWDKHQSINEGCDIKSRSFFKFQFEEAVRKYRNRNVIVAMHHPLFSNGNHGGYFTAKEHVFPLTAVNDNLYLPLPGIGSLLAFFRGTVGIPQDISNGKYKAMRKDILAGLTKNGTYIVASGHEHGLQYLEKDRQIQIVSGSGSKENPTRVGNGGEFGYAKRGYSKVDFYEDGSAWVEFYALSDSQDSFELVFKKKIKDKLEISEDNIPKSFPEYDKHETVKVRRPNNYELKKVSWLHKATLGEHYLPEYMEDYPFEVMDLETYKGGLTPVKRGGGNQTNSLRLVDKDGRQYTMRSLTKDASRALPYPANQVAVAEKILQDNFLSAYPFAASIVPKMSDAANVYHANPSLFYVPKQPRLGLHNDIFGDDVYLVEERVGGNWETQPTLGSSKKLISTLDVSEKITNKHKYRIDHEWLVRSKLFDIMIQDWDRHDDQWRWATFENEKGKGKFYRPIPRDRDQAFSKYDGVLMRIIGLMSPFYKSLQNFGPEMKDIRWASWNGKYFDTNFLGEAGREDWMKAAQYIQENVTDEIIDQAFLDVPEAARTERWEEMKANVKSRKNNLDKYAAEAYAYNSKKVDVLGTNQRDLFEIERKDETTILKGYSYKKGKKGKVFYERTFENDFTKEISLYTFGDKDLIHLTGEGSKGIKIRVIGGLDKDEFVDESFVHGLGKKSLFYDSSVDKNKMELGKEGKDKTSKHVDLNTYDRKHVHYQTDWTLPLVILGYNQDMGLNVGFDFTHYRYKFKKAPYGESHRFIADYASSPNSINLSYKGSFIEVLGSWDLILDAQYSGDRTSFNYFGFGNESINVDPNDLFHNRVRQGKRFALLGIQRRFAANNGKFSLGPFFERSNIKDIAGRFLSTFNDAPQAIFEDINYAGAQANLEYKSVDAGSDPHRGFVFKASSNLEQNVDDSDFNFIGLNTELTIYTPLNRSESVLLATKLGYSSISGGDYHFFKAPTIGGFQSLRGFRNQRFRGDQTFFHSTDIRLKLFQSINKVVPFTLGLHGGFDYGKVWKEGSDSDVWHSSYGGGIYIAPINAIIFSFGYYLSEEDEQFLFNVGHMF